MRHTPSGGEFALEKFPFCHCMLESLLLAQFCSLWVTLVSVTLKIAAASWQNLSTSSLTLRAQPHHSIKHLSHFSVSV